MSTAPRVGRGATCGGLSAKAAGGPEAAAPAAAARGRDGGFTMIEVLVSVGILASMMAIIWGSFSLTARTKSRVEAVEERYHEIRLAMGRMAREISMAYLSKNDQPATTTPRTMFVGTRGSKIDELMFSSFSHMRLNADAKECDQTLVRYYGAPDPDDRRRTNLMRRASRRLGVQRPGEDGPAYAIVENVTELRFEYFDEVANEWKETWNTRSADGQPDRLPTNVRISLTVPDDQGIERELSFISGTRVHMRDPLWFSAGT